MKRFTAIVLACLAMASLAVLISTTGTPCNAALSDAELSAVYGGCGPLECKSSWGGCAWPSSEPGCFVIEYPWPLPDQCEGWVLGSDCTAFKRACAAPTYGPCEAYEISCGGSYVWYNCNWLPYEGSIQCLPDASDPETHDCGGERGWCDFN
jgi:hypothetical protein